MRIRKTTEKWNVKAFLLIFVVLAAVYNGFFVLAYGKGGLQAGDEIRFWLLNGLAMPAIIAVAITTSLRKRSLLVAEYNDVADFRAVLMQHLTSSGMMIEEETTSRVVLKPASWFYRLFNAWFRSELLEVKFSEEITITGTLKRISFIEDILNLHPDFKK